MCSTVSPTTPCPPSSPEVLGRTLSLLLRFRKEEEGKRMSSHGWRAARGPAGQHVGQDVSCLNDADGSANLF
ncbi:hypothetical protein E2C01_030450 [Portunus trituberculatus]|uniref:Uncharacterized protein n=1 Tax=Portunus trituberculatus TaxID=210409 RepID=A0A5B7EVC7_PORTR|nr:hypothetical protein [Portunus trituberculatus]